ncbi:hypothetical protein [Caldinitratiruptor microaerophilus]|uniref:SWIM-type domain-containing protein n=1 Tax=Caldinitratiruptor microaerophilus TaxID=671077 RepID=A0AA35CKW1_9FIRM|nr:hypothetical protein [Caldinitratiruptor microaerophilus]BDG60399.1 hypothetical protein caldi_14890 [Caldinitratiruptor microaerophilus]
MAAGREPEWTPGWWGRRWLEYLADAYALGMSPGEARRARRKRAAVTVRQGLVVARVERGSSGDVETVELRVKRLSQRAWDRVVAIVAADPELARALLAGNVGAELEERLRAHGIDLFPPPAGWRDFRCTCWHSRPCSHMRALGAHMADLLDQNPFLWLEVLGQPRAELFARVRGCLADAAGAAAAVSPRAAGPGRRGRAGSGPGGAASLSIERFWETPVDPASIPVRPGRSGAAGALVRALGPLPLPDEAQGVWLQPPPPEGPDEPAGAAGAARGLPFRVPLTEALQRYAGHVGRQAAALSTGEAPAVHRPWPLPGQPLPIGERLAQEVAEAVWQREEVLDVADLRSVCPTAAALPPHGAAGALREALRHLPPDVTVLAGNWVGTRSAVLTGATFRHVLTFDEWCCGDLDLDADWARALRLAGASPPFTVRALGREWPVGAPERQGGREEGLVAALGAEPGDELWLAVAEPAGAVLEARRVPLAERNPAESARADARAAEALLAHVRAAAAGGRWQLGEADAVAVLLARGAYRGGTPPADLWVLPGLGTGLYHAQGTFATPGERSFTYVSYGWYAWPPPLPGPWTARGPRDSRRLLDRYAARAARWGRAPHHVHGSVTLVERWHGAWPAPHDDPATTPGILWFLRFLWLEAPRLSRSLHLPAEVALGALAEWFEFLGERRPALRDSYRAHAAACTLVAAFDHRRRTLPFDRRPDDPAVRAWQVEGYRWIGPALLGGAEGG